MDNEEQEEDGLDVDELAIYTNDELKSLYKKHEALIKEGMEIWQKQMNKYEAVLEYNKEQAEAYAEVLLELNANLCELYVRKELIQKIM